MAWRGSGVRIPLAPQISTEQHIPSTHEVRTGGARLRTELARVCKHRIPAEVIRFQQGFYAVFDSIFRKLRSSRFWDGVHMLDT